MAKVHSIRERLSIDVLPEEHRQIKAYAALHGKTLREYILESVRERIREEAERKGLSNLTTNLSRDPVLKELWNNDKDSAYDKI